MKTSENVSYWRATELPGIEICQVRDSRHVFPNHIHDRLYAIGLMEKGGSYCLGPARSDAFVAPGEMALINPGQVHSGVPRPHVPTSYRMIYLDADLLLSVVRDCREGDGAMPEFRRLIVRDRRLRAMLERVFASMMGTGCPMEKESFFFEAAAHLVSVYGGIKTAGGRITDERSVIRRARSFLSADLDRKVSLEAAAQAVGLSRYHFLRVFKRATGLPPHLFRTQCRIDRAKALLRRGLPPAQVALETGFADQSHFANKFRYFIGATPKQYLSATR